MNFGFYLLMDRPIIFLVIIGVTFLLFMNYGGSSFFSQAPLATGPGSNQAVRPIPEPPSERAFSFPTTFRAPVQSPTTSEPEKLKPGYSPFREKITIVSVGAPRSARPIDESITIRFGSFFSGFSKGDERIDIGGWTLENRRGTQVEIPLASEIYGATASAPIALHGGEEVIIATAHPTFSESFRENRCTGYLNESHSFVPQLSEYCQTYSLDDLFARNLNNACIDLVLKSRRCRQVRIAFEQMDAGNACVAFAGEHLNYAGCLKENREKPDFLLGVWRVFLRRSETLWDPTHDRIILRDKNGLIVDEYAY